MLRLIRAMLLTGGLLAPAACGAPQAVSRAAPESFSPLVKQVLPAVVNIAVTETVNGNEALADLPPELRDTPLGKQFRDRFRNRNEQVLGAGSGFVIDPSGIIVTNNHVVGHADRILVSLNDGTELPARVLGADDLLDLAVIKVDPPHPLPHVSFGDSSKVEVGDWILACGNPFGLGGSVTAGIVSARGRDLGAGPFDDYLQLDAPINPGNSGGPTFNMDGQVIGLNTAIVSPSGGSVGIGFAIPSALAAPAVATLRAHGHIDRGWLGVSLAEPNSEEPGGAPVTPKSDGVEVATVDSSGPAGRAGVRPGDLILSVNGAPVATARGVVRAIAAIAPGDAARLTIRRDGRQMEVSVTVGRRPAESQN